MRTPKMINSPACCHPLKGLLRVIGIDLQPARTADAESKQNQLLHVLAAVARFEGEIIRER
jgi:hypothetical protein